MSTDPDAWLGSLDRYLTREPDPEEELEDEFSDFGPDDLPCFPPQPPPPANLLRDDVLEQQWLDWYGACATDEECPF